MKIYDITLPISKDLPVWPGDPLPELVPVSSIAAGDGSNISAIRLGTHTGTHLDAPRHIFPEGAAVDQLPLEQLVGDAWVCRVPSSVRAVDAAVLERARIPKGTRRLLLRTANSERRGLSPQRFTPEYVALRPDAARWVIDRGIVLLGVDYLSVDLSDAPDLPAHRILLSHGVVVLEGIDLRRVRRGSYRLICLPLRLQGSDGAPARAILVAGDATADPAAAGDPLPPA